MYNIIIIPREIERKKMKLPNIIKKTHNLNLIFKFKRNKIYKKKIKNLRTIGIKFGTELEIIKRNDD